MLRRQLPLLWGQLLLQGGQSTEGRLPGTTGRHDGPRQDSQSCVGLLVSVAGVLGSARLRRSVLNTAVTVVGAGGDSGVVVAGVLRFLFLKKKNQ